jgi:hypothetical protein
MCAMAQSASEYQGSAELRRNPRPSTRVNNANPSVRIHQNPKRAENWQKKRPLPAHSQDALIGAR